MEVVVPSRARSRRRVVVADRPRPGRPERASGQGAAARAARRVATACLRRLASCAPRAATSSAGRTGAWSSARPPRSRASTPTVTADGVFRLLEAALEVLPDVAELELVAARAGLRPGTAGGRPVIGPGDRDGLLWATGHGRNGVLLAPLTAARVVELLRDGPTMRSARQPFASGASSRSVGTPTASGAS
ncbi:MAG: FAD-dependent oxidoreductase [Thermoleophilaceae bacterium]